MRKKSIGDADIRGKKVLIRVDYNVPLNDQKEVTDDARIAKSLPTLRYCLENNCKIVLMSHLGRPKGKPEAKYSLKPASDKLSQLIAKPVKLLSDCVGEEVKKQVNGMKAGEIIMLENLRFHAEEEKNDAVFAKELAGLGEVFVNDAFGAAHRAHASVEAVTKFLPSVAGFLLAKEIEYFEKAVSSPERPFVTILGGAKVSDKVKLISNLLEKADVLLVGGAMAYTFYKVLGIKIGTSKFEPEGVAAAEEALKKAEALHKLLVLPTDRVISEKFEKGAACKVVDGDIPDGWMGLDIGPKSVELFKKHLSTAKTIVWNGPVGVFEMPPFDKGTRALAEYVATLDATTIIGGGDTAAAVKIFNLEDKMSHVSTGGGASLEYLEGRTLPGVAALQDK